MGALRQQSIAGTCPLTCACCYRNPSWLEHPWTRTRGRTLSMSLPAPTNNQQPAFAQAKQSLDAFITQNDMTLIGNESFVHFTIHNYHNPKQQIVQISWHSLYRKSELRFHFILDKYVDHMFCFTAKQNSVEVIKSNEVLQKCMLTIRSVCEMHKITLKNLINSINHLKTLKICNLENNPNYRIFYLEFLKVFKSQI